MSIMSIKCFLKTDAGHAYAEAYWLVLSAFALSNAVAWAVRMSKEK
jgi:hypothetical protein